MHKISVVDVATLVHVSRSLAPMENNIIVIGLCRGEIIHCDDGCRIAVVNCFEKCDAMVSQNG